MNPMHSIPMYSHVLALVCAIITAVLALVLPTDKAVSRLNSDLASHEAQTVFLPLPPLPETELSRDESPEASSTSESWRMTIVRAGDSLTQIFTRLGLRTEDLYTLLSSGNEAETFSHVHPGQVFRVRTDAEGSLLEIIHETDEIGGKHATREGAFYRISEYFHEIEKRSAFGSGTIRKSLYQSAQEAGLSDRIIMQLAEIFGWDIDFALDIRPGDSFTVLYEEDYLAGKNIGNGNILAAEFTNQGQTYRAVRYTHPDGSTHYYTPEGRGMRQAFLRSPVDFRRISSHFQPNRWHPVLGKKRPHRGVDYAAAAGTPIQAAGDGEVIFIGKKGGYGNTIILQHGKRYTTLYAHMSRFKKGLRRGVRVSQGEIIGYVGQSGLATGPHLHYEFRVDGVHQNPVTVELPGSLPIDSRYLADFQRRTEPLIAQIDLYKRTLLALNEAR